MVVSILHFSISIFHYSFLGRLGTKDEHLPGRRTSHGWQSRSADEYIRGLRYHIDDRQSISSGVRLGKSDKLRSDKLLSVKVVSADSSSAVRLCHPREFPNARRGSRINLGRTVPNREVMSRQFLSGFDQDKNGRSRDAIARLHLALRH